MLRMRMDTAPDTIAKRDQEACLLPRLRFELCSRRAEWRDGHRRDPWPLTTSIAGPVSDIVNYE